MIYVGIDIDKDKHNYFISNSDGKVLCKVFTITNNPDGFNNLCLLQLSTQIFIICTISNSYNTFNRTVNFGIINRRYLHIL